MHPLAPLAMAGALWTGGLAPPAPTDSLPVTRALPDTAARVATAPRWMVASAHPLASLAGARILAAGGSAADAGVAVQAALSVVEPESSGPGGGCFILYHDAPRDTLWAIDGREELPAWNRADMFMEAGRIVPEPYTGGAAVGVPGTVDAMSRLHALAGRLPLREVLAPAVAIADTGFAVGPDLARASRDNAFRLRRYPASRALYLRDDGSPLAEGDRLRNCDLADFFRHWADEPTGRFFYQGDLAWAITAAVGGDKFRKGRMMQADLGNYHAPLREPVVGSYRGRRIVAFPPPTSGGITLLEILGILETRPAPPDPRGGDAALLAFLDGLARASRVAYADRDRYLGDPDWSPDVPMRGLLDPAFVAQQARAAFDPAAPLDSLAAAGDPPAHTTHFCVVDAEGSVLSCTSTIETVFGSAMVLPGWGFVLNNELTDFNLVPAAGEDYPRPNDIQGGRRIRATALDGRVPPGGKRPRSSMCPVIVYGDDGRPELALGSPGGARIIGTVAGTLLLLLDHDFTLAEALAFPRLHCRNRPLEIETWGWNRGVLADSLGARGWPVAPLTSWPLLQGDVQALRILPDGRRRGASDPRHDGAPRGG